MKKERSPHPDLVKRITALRDVPERDPHRASAGRARFLTDAARILPTVSTPADQRHMNRIPRSRKERFMMNAVIAAVVAFVLLFGGGATVAAAQDDLPDQALYPLKTLTEDVRLWLNTDPETEVDMLMEMIQLRVEEMIMLQAEGQVPPANVTERLQQHIHLALQAAAGMGEESMQGALQNIHTQLQQHQMVMQVLMTQSTGDLNHVMAQTATMLENRIRMVEEGMADPQGFINTVRQEQEQRTGQEGEPPYQNQSSGSPTDDSGQGNGEQQGQQGTETPREPQGTPGPHGNNGGNGNHP